MANLKLLIVLGAELDVKIPILKLVIWLQIQSLLMLAAKAFLSFVF